MLAEIGGRLVEADDRVVAAERQQHDARAMLAERRIELQGTRQDFRAEKRSRTVPDQNDLLGFAGLRDVADMLREAVEPLVGREGALAVRELPGPDRVAHEIEQVGALFRVFQNGPEQAEEQDGRRKDGESQRGRRLHRVLGA